MSFGFEQGVALGNSSTNFNRKRSAYVLKRFFCDDLTPIGFERPAGACGRRARLATRCYACHYKLDPMAGFFRCLGAHFFDYSRSPDDHLRRPRRDKPAALRGDVEGPATGNRKWNVGFVRSPAARTRTATASRWRDLSSIFATAPELKRCLIKRLHEYIVAEDQTIDGGYLDYLTREFEAEAAVSSSAAVKNAIVRVVKSDAYDERNAEPQRCYDHAPGSVAGQGPPCRVALSCRRIAPSATAPSRAATPARSRRVDHRARRPEPHVSATSTAR